MTTDTHDSYKNNRHSTGVLLVNLGTPEAPTPSATRKFLRQFLSDPRVIELPRVIRWLLLNLVILPFRPYQTAKLYQTIWTDAGSPLLLHSKNITHTLQSELTSMLDTPIHVELGMCYGTPSVKDALSALRAKKIRRLIVLPLYPQYSATTSAATFDTVFRVLSEWRWLPECHLIDQYYDNDAYVDAIAKQIAGHIQHNHKPQKFVFSFHGLPKRLFKKGDPYYCFCMKSARLIAQRANLNDNDYCVTFQSRLGKAEWLTPYTDKTLESLPAQGIKNIAVICPGFSVDCLETLEEINIQNRELFIKSGGESFTYIPALNDSPDQIQLLTTLVQSQLPPKPVTSQ